MPPTNWRRTKVAGIAKRKRIKSKGRGLIYLVVRLIRNMETADQMAKKSE